MGLGSADRGAELSIERLGSNTANNTRASAPADEPADIAAAAAAPGAADSGGEGSMNVAGSGGGSNHRAHGNIISIGSIVGRNEWGIGIISIPQQSHTVIVSAAATIVEQAVVVLVEEVVVVVRTDAHRSSRSCGRSNHCTHSSRAL